jgi:hypothetical protein
MPFAVGVKAQHPAGSPAAADRVTLMPDEHRREVAVEDDIARIEIIAEQPATGIRRNDHPDGGKFLVSELADLARRMGHGQTLGCSPAAGNDPAAAGELIAPHT